MQRVFFVISNFRVFVILRLFGRSEFAGQSSTAPGEPSVAFPRGNANHPPMGNGGAPGAGVRIAAALLSVALAALLLVPSDAPVHRVSWDDLIAPFGVGLPVVNGYFLSPPRRGEEHDVVYVARRDPGPDGPAARVEIHVLDRGRWSGIAETKSFGIGWEEPPRGSLIPAPRDDALALRDALAAAIAENDDGLPSVDSIPLESEPQSPPMARVLDRLHGPRGLLVGTAAVSAVVLLVAVPRGTAVLGFLLFALGLALRAASLGVPFTHDQDVQRLFTGNMPLHEIATGAGLRDRHPPLYFFILHFAQLFGQSEAVVRAPAVLAGALVGPALLLATASMRGRVGPGAALLAFAATISPELVARSREVSEIPLYSLIVVAASASLAAAARRPGKARLVSVALSHALAFFTYYLAPFLAAAHAVVLAWFRPGRRLAIAFAAGILGGLPALALGLVTLLRDWAARDVARAFPALAWGEHSPLPMAALMTRIAADAFGLPLLVLIVAAIVAGTMRRDIGVITPALGAAATFAGIALLSPIARVQGYYVVTILPLAALAAAVFAEPKGPRLRAAWLAAQAIAIVAATVPSLAGARSLYLADADAFMPRFARVIASRPNDSVVTVAHYDKTLLAYYLARLDGRSIAWDSIDSPAARRIEGLVLVHTLDAASEATAVKRLDEILAAGPALVIERDAFLLPKIVARLSGCERLLQAPSARIVRCAADSAG
jgi:hypothetical protein